MILELYQVREGFLSNGALSAVMAGGVWGRASLGMAPGVPCAPGGKKETSQGVLQMSDLRYTRHTGGLWDLSRNRERAVNF